MHWRQTSQYPSSRRTAAASYPAAPTCTLTPAMHVRGEVVKERDGPQDRPGGPVRAVLSSGLQALLDGELGEVLDVRGGLVGCLGPPRSPEVYTMCCTPWETAASIKALPWDSSTSLCTWTRKRPESAWWR